MVPTDMTATAIKPPSPLASAVFLARYVLLETWREGTLWLALGLGGLIALAGLFVSQLPITESAETAVLFNASFFRLCAAVLVVLRVVSSTVRLNHDRVFDWLLAMPLSRPALVIGLFVGHALFAMSLAALCTAALALSVSSVPALLTWSIALMIELLFVAACAFMFAVVLAQWSSAALAAGAVYVLARVMGSLLLLGGSRLNTPSSADQLLDTVLKLISWFLPSLDVHLNADILVRSTEFHLLSLNSVHAVLLSALCIVVACVDLQRKNL